jgi:hypothetical protein
MSAALTAAVIAATVVPRVRVGVRYFFAVVAVVVFEIFFFFIGKGLPLVFFAVVHARDAIPNLVVDDTTTATGDLGDLYISMVFTAASLTGV